MKYDEIKVDTWVGVKTGYRKYNRFDFHHFHWNCMFGVRPILLANPFLNPTVTTIKCLTIRYDIRIKHGDRTVAAIRYHWKWTLEIEKRLQLLSKDHSCIEKMDGFHVYRCVTPKMNDDVIWCTLSIQWFGGWGKDLWASIFPYLGS